MLLLSFVSMGQTVMASVIPKWCIAQVLALRRIIEEVKKNRLPAVLIFIEASSHRGYKSRISNTWEVGTRERGI